MNKKQYSTMSNVLYVLHNSIQIQKKLWFILVLYVVSSAILEYSVSIISSSIVDALETKTDVSWIIGFNVICFCVCLFFYVVYVVTKGELDWRLYSVRTKFIERLMNKVMTMDYEKLELPSVQDLKRKAFNTTSGTSYGIQGMVETSIQNILSAVKLILALVLISRKSVIIIILISILTIIHFAVIDKTKKMEKKYTWDIMMPIQRKIEYLQSITSDFAFGKDIRLFQMGVWLTGKTKRENEKAHHLIKKAQNRWILSFGVNQIIDMIQNVILYGWIIVSVLDGKMGIAGLVLYLQIVPIYKNNLNSLLDNIADTRKKSLEINDYRTFMELFEMKEIKRGFIDKKQYTIQFDHVSFCYSGQEQFTLKDINLTIKQGEKLAIVGLNGAGKTTLVKLLLRLYEPTQGRILFNGVDIKEIDKEEYFRLFATMFQENEIYAFSMAENISMRKMEYTDNERVKEVCQMAGIGEKIATLPMKYDSQLSKALYDDGIDLSGGERQKVALARALYKESDIIVLDEPTASLDALAEGRLYKEFDRLIGKKTAIYISHRLASTRFCDCIVVMKDGSVVQYGNHDMLINETGLYKELFEVQSKYYKESEGDENGTI